MQRMESVTAFDDLLCLAHPFLFALFTKTLKSKVTYPYLLKWTQMVLALNLKQLGNEHCLPMVIHAKRMEVCW